jgi:ketosteroid isomerase-like protein
MTWKLGILLLPLITVLCAHPVHATGSSALDSLVTSERAFAAMSVEKGVREAFLTFLSEDGLIFRPLAQNGRKAWESRGPVPVTLVWEPAYAEVSAAGDLGFTTGPWELRPHDPERRVGHGHYVSVWQKQPDGQWRVVLDIGTSHGPPAQGVEDVEFVAGPSHADWLPGRAPSLPLPNLAEVEQEYAKEAGEHGLAAAFRKRAARDVRFYRDGELPRAGAASARRALGTRPGTTTWAPEGTRVAVSGDLGYTYGILECRASGQSQAAPDSSVYLHIWRRGPDRNWKVALALENPIRRAQPE